MTLVSWTLSVYSVYLTSPARLAQQNEDWKTIEEFLFGGRMRKNRAEEKRSRVPLLYWIFLKSLGLCRIEKLEKIRLRNGHLDKPRCCPHGLDSNLAIA